jgi:hypothetical protein
MCLDIKDEYVYIFNACQTSNVILLKMYFMCTYIVVQQSSWEAYMYGMLLVFTKKNPFTLKNVFQKKSDSNFR